MRKTISGCSPPTVLALMVYEKSSVAQKGFGNSYRLVIYERHTTRYVVRTLCTPRSIRFADGKCPTRLYGKSRVELGLNPGRKNMLIVRAARPYKRYASFFHEINKTNKKKCPPTHEIIVFATNNYPRPTNFDVSTLSNANVKCSNSARSCYPSRNSCAVPATAKNQNRNLIHILAYRLEFYFTQTTT